MTAANVTVILQRGLAFHQAGQLNEAEREYRSVIAQDVKNYDAYNLLGLIASSRGLKIEALDLFNQAIQASSLAASPHFNKANTLAEMGRDLDALDSYREAIRLRPDYADASLNLGVLLHRLNRLGEATISFQEMVRRCPNDARGFFNLGRCYADSKNISGAKNAYTKALELDANYVDALVALAHINAEASDLSQAITLLQRALRREPQNGELHSLLAHFFSRSSRQDEAVQSYKTAYALNPKRPEFLFNLGTALYAAGQLDQAEEFLRKTIDVAPTYTNAYVNLGQVLVDLNRTDEGLALFEQALSADPQNSHAADNKGAALSNKGFALLASGQYEAGWSFYRHRFDHTTRSSGRREFEMPVWLGEDAADKKLLLWTDQGLGDEIMYAGMVPDALNSVGDCILECADRLVPLFERSFPKAKIVGRSTPPDQRIFDATPDIQSSVADLGGFFRRHANSFPKHKGYLTADPRKVAALRSDYALRAEGDLWSAYRGKAKALSRGRLKLCHLMNGFRF